MQKLHKSIRWIEDPGHGWLKVPKSLLSREQVKRISPFSFESTRYYYLEEDCDAEIYLETIPQELWSLIPCKHYSDWDRTKYKRVNGALQDCWDYNESSY